MKALVQRVYSNPSYAKVLEWSKLLTITGSAQVVVQVIGFASGILIIRLLSTQEYAFYTIVSTMSGAMIMLADGGISTGVLAQGGKVWQSKEKLGVVIATGISLRKRFSIISLLFAIPAMLFLLRQQHATWGIAILITVSLIPGFLSTLFGNLLDIAPKLRQDISPLQKIQVLTNLGRLALLCISLFIFPWAFIAILAAGLPQIWANRRLEKVSSSYADRNQKADPVIQKEILGTVKRTLPDAIYSCLSGQVTIWLLSIFGSTVALSQLGALSRLSVIINLFNILFYTLVLPRFARLPNNSILLIKRYAQIQVGLLFLTSLIVTVIWFFSSEVLWILGPKFSGLTNQLVLIMAASCLSSIAGLSFYLCTSRGWVINPVISIPVNILSIICGAYLLDVSSLHGILILNIVIAIVNMTMHVSYGIIRILTASKINTA
ncbi:lipopolysaccharide biosynthesis protein [Segetibacter koreensis]|uniref:lipopolysaccharide biosynthesis protein n=1 Tax=Segetibacter koreensis TaxID=398037 RepID=UPI00037B1FF1|nr:hypothetical protein [Segetibacter koreensis]